MITIKKKQSARMWTGTAGAGGTQVAQAESWTETWVDGSKVVISWTAPIGSFDVPASNYSIYKNGQFLVSVPATQTSYEDTVVMSGITYTYVVNLNYRL